MGQSVSSIGLVKTSRSRQRTVNRRRRWPLYVRIDSSRIAKAAAGIVAGAVTAGRALPFRRATYKERREMLQCEDLSELQAICMALRLKKVSSKAGTTELIELIEQTLAHDDAIYQPDSPTGKLAAHLFQLSDEKSAAKQVTLNFKVKDLKELCSCLRLSSTGKKADLALRLVAEMRSTFPAISALDEHTVQTRAAGTEAAEPAEAAAASAAASAAARPAPARTSDAILEEPATEVAELVEEPRVAQERPVQHSANSKFGGPENLGSTDNGELRKRQQGLSVESSHPAMQLDDTKADINKSSLRGVQDSYAESYATTLMGSPSAPSREVPGTRLAQEDASSFKVVEEIPHSREAQAKHDVVVTDVHEKTWTPSYQAVDGERAAASIADGEFATGVVQTKAIPDAESERQERKARRKAKRRMKFMSYFAEELASAYGGHKENYMRDMCGIVEGLPENVYTTYVDDVNDTSSSSRRTLSLPCGEVTEPPLEHMVMRGEVGRARGAWCTWWDNDTGCGELIDSADKERVGVVSSDLQTAANVRAHLKYLYPKEFVEYRRVETEGGALRAALVRGHHGWPLRCEVDSQP